MATAKQIRAITDIAGGATALEQYAALNQQAFDKLADVTVPGVEWHNWQRSHWLKSASGSCPSLEAYKLVYALFADRSRPGREMNWGAMTLRPEGASMSEFTSAKYAPNAGPGGPAHVFISKYSDQKKPGDASAFLCRIKLSGDGHAGRFYHVITDAGMKQLDKRIAVLTGNAPVKVAKPKKAKANVPAVIVESAEYAGPVTETPTVETVTPNAFLALAAKYND